CFTHILDCDCGPAGGGEGRTSRNRVFFPPGIHIVWTDRQCPGPVTHLSSGLTLLLLTPELAGRADLREGCPYGKAEKVHAGVPSGGCGVGAGYGSADRARGRGDRRGCATAGSLGPAGTRAARSASEPGDAFPRCFIGLVSGGSRRGCRRLAADFGIRV